MSDEQDFRRAAEAALGNLKRHLFAREESEQAGFEVEEQSGVLNILFEDPAARFVITPNAPVRQIWISALATSFKLDWDSSSRNSSCPAPAKLSAPSSIASSASITRQAPAAFESSHPGPYAPAFCYDLMHPL